ncbi:MAG: prolyl oligopeptidase family serine peptidase [Deltaproteobacteria bacterium]|nr:prolyl oligopeptidase family serine peptidase [Deltaproteobacteria bacterium]
MKIHFFATNPSKADLLLPEPAIPKSPSIAVQEKGAHFGEAQGLRKRLRRISCRTLRSSVAVALGLGSLLTGCSGSASGHPPSTAVETTLEYPSARRGKQVDEYHGVAVADPYRWMEEDSPETASWIHSQVELLQRFVEPVLELEELETRLQQIRHVDRWGLPVRRGDRFFLTHIPAGDLHGSLYVQQGLLGKKREVLSFAEMIPEADHSMGGFAVSPDGNHVVWASQSQSSWGWLDVARVKTGERLPERLEGIAGNSAIWTHDSQGFFYLRYGDYASLEAGTVNPRPAIYYHRLNTSQESDQLIYERPDRPSMLFTPKLSDDGRFLVVGLNDGARSRNQVVFRNLALPGASFQTLIEQADASYVFEGSRGEEFLFRTTWEAPRGRVVAIDLGKPQRSHWREVIPERQAPLGSVSHIGDRLVVVSTVHARPVVEVWNAKGELESTLDLPAIGLVSGFMDDPTAKVSFYRLNSLVDPGTVFRVNIDSGKSEVQQRSELAHDPEDYEIKQVFYPGQDGTRIPMFLAHRKDSPLRENRPLWMYGYGHGGWVAFPWFQPHLVAWMDMGGTYALPGLRGGGEYGAQWQEAGTRLEKLTTIDDYVAAAEWLVQKGYTSPERLVANGGSASGVVPAAAAVKRPDLFAASVIDFPFLDMLRYHHFNIVQGWTEGYGSVDDEGDFEVLKAYSPVHNLEPGKCYPSTLTVVGGKDITTPPLHGFKFTAALQAAQGCDRAGLLKFIPKAGHYSYGTTPQETARTEAEILAFLVRSLGLSSDSKQAVTSP